MAPTHHPSDQSLQDYSALQLGAGAALLVASHLERCVACNNAHLARVSGRLNAGDITTRGDNVAPFPPLPAMAGGSKAPKAMGDLTAFSALGAFARGPWRWAGPGLRTASVEGAAGLGERVYLLRGQPGARLPRHSHRGSEWVLVAQGSYLDDGELYQVGDVSEHHATHTHGLTVTSPAECVCLVVSDQPPRIHGIGRLLEPFLKL